MVPSTSLLVPADTRGRVAALQRCVELALLGKTRREGFLFISEFRRQRRANSPAVLKDARSRWAAVVGVCQELLWCRRALAAQRPEHSKAAILSAVCPSARPLLQLRPGWVEDAALSEEFFPLIPMGTCSENSIFFLQLQTEGGEGDFNLSPRWSLLSAP